MWNVLFLPLGNFVVNVAFQIKQCSVLVPCSVQSILGDQWPTPSGGIPQVRPMDGTAKQVSPAMVSEVSVPVYQGGSRIG